MKWPYALAIAPFVFLACDQSPDVSNPRQEQAPAKVETSTNGVITKGGVDISKPGWEADALKTVKPAGLAKAAVDLNQKWVGMVPAGDPNVQSCPDGYEWLRLDDEDSGNNDKFIVNGTDYSGHDFWAGGFAHISSPRRAGGNSRITYCKQQRQSLPVLAYDYAVISASNVCPDGSYRFTRRWDNEDSGNHNSQSAGAAPNVASDGSGGYAYINFCFVPGAAGWPTWDPSLNGFVILTKQQLTNRATFYTDDEDDGNNNQYSSTNSNYTSRMQQIVSGGSNTYIYFATQSTLSTQDLGTAIGCSDYNWKIGLKCDYGTDGVRRCQPIGGVDDYINFAKQMYCLW